LNLLSHIEQVLMYMSLYRILKLRVLPKVTCQYARAFVVAFG